MKKIITIITLSLFALSAKAQMTQYNVYMDSVGTVHISTSKTTALALSAYYSNLVNVPSLQTAPTVNSGVTRPINSTTFTVSTTKLAWVSYTVNISCTATIGSTANGKVALQYSTNAGSTWIDVADASNSNTVTLAVALQSVNTSDMVISGCIPANALVRMVSTITGTATTTFVRAQETY